MILYVSKYYYYCRCRIYLFVYNKLNAQLKLSIIEKKVSVSYVQLIILQEKLIILRLPGRHDSDLLRYRSFGAGLLT
jgi:hypothetical protein